MPQIIFENERAILQTLGNGYVLFERAHPKDQLYKSSVPIKMDDIAYNTELTKMTKMVGFDQKALYQKVQKWCRR